MVTLKINGRKLEMATHYADLSVDQTQRIASQVDFEKIEEDWIKLFNILCNGNFKVESVEAQQKILKTISWCLTGIEFPKVMPEVINFKGQEIEIPRTINLTIGQAIALKRAIYGVKYVDAVISKACAIYLQPLIDNAKFSIARANEIEQDILKMHAFLFHAMGNFILRALQNAGITSMNPRSLIQNSLSKILRNLLPIWLIAVVWPVMGIFLLSYGTLKCFRWILITFSKTVRLILFATYSSMIKSTRNSKIGMMSTTIN